VTPPDREKSALKPLPLDTVAANVAVQASEVLGSAGYHESVGAVAYPHPGSSIVTFGDTDPEQVPPWETHAARHDAIDVNVALSFEHVKMKLALAKNLPSPSAPKLGALATSLYTVPATMV